MTTCSEQEITAVFGSGSTPYRCITETGNVSECTVLQRAVRNSPEWDEHKMLNESDELGLYRHYGKTLDAGLRGGQLR